MAFMDKFYLLPFVFLLFLERFFLLATLDTSSIGVFSIFAGIFLLSFLVRECWQDAILPYISKYLPDWKQVRKILGMGCWVYGVTACCICVLGICFLPVLSIFFPYFSDYRWMYLLFILRSAVLFCFSTRHCMLPAKKYGNYLFLWESISLLAGGVLLYITESLEAYLMVSIFATLAMNLHLSFLAGKRYPYILRIRPVSSAKLLFARSYIWYLLEDLPFFLSMFLILAFQGVYQVYSYSNYILVFLAMAMFLHKTVGSVDVLDKNGFCRTATKVHIFSLLASAILVGCSSACAQLLSGSTHTMSIVFLSTLNWYLFFMQQPLHAVMKQKKSQREYLQITLIGISIFILCGILFGKAFGLIGILLSLTITYAYMIPKKITAVFHHGFHQSGIRYTASWISYLCSILVVLVFGVFVQQFAPGNLFLSLLVRGGSCLLIAFLLDFVLFGKDAKQIFRKLG